MKLRIRSAGSLKPYFEALGVETVYIDEYEVKITRIEVFGDTLTITTDKEYKVEDLPDNSISVEKEVTEDARKD